MNIRRETASQPSMLSGHPVLEFLNTKPMVEGELQDLLQTDADVGSMLRRLGWPTAFEGSGLLLAARNLREELRRLFECRKAGKSLRLEQLDRFLAQAESHLELSQARKGSLALQRVWKQRTPQQALSPLAEAAAELLVTGDIELIRRCESETCVLWFYDRTKSHRRRWCSMDTCGNRHKVTAFRKRQSES